MRRYELERLEVARSGFMLSQWALGNGLGELQMLAVTAIFCKR